MIPIALLEKFSSYNFITGFKVSHLTRHSSEPNKLRNENPIKGRSGNGTSPFKNEKNYYVKIKVRALIINFD